jgi:hypothetical protein
MIRAASAELEGLSPRDGIHSLFASLDAFPGDDPATLLVSEAYLAASRDSGLKAALGAELVAFRDTFASWLHSHGETDAETKAAAIAALGDGLILHRALGQPVSGEAIAELALRMLDVGSESTSKEEQ